MLKLMNLEWRKLGIAKYLLSCIVLTVAIIGIILILIAVQEEGDIVLSEVMDFFWVGDILMRVSFTILSSVLLAQVIIKEFETGTIQILFTFPINRKKIMLSKLFVVVSSTLVFFVIAEIIFITVITLLNNYFQLMAEDITLSMIKSVIPKIVFSIVTATGVSLIPLFFGMMKKSVIVTVSSSVVVALVLNGNIGISNQYSLSSSMVIPSLLCIAGITLAIISYSNINKIDF